MNSTIDLMFFHEVLFLCHQHQLYPSVKCNAIPVQCLLDFNSNAYVYDIEVDLRLSLVHLIPLGVVQPVLKRLAVLLMADKPVATT